MDKLVYVFVAFIATVIGSISGMGGGIIMKPVFDMLNAYSTLQIAVLTSSTAFMMAVVSVLLSIPTIKKEKLKINIMLTVSIGSVIGGYIGENIFSFLTSNCSDIMVKIVQNIVLIIVISFVIIYMRKPDSRKTLNSSNSLSGLIVGIILGIHAAFLGIGGGPVNVAIIIFAFGCNIKAAAICSLTTIVFSQATKLISMSIVNGTEIFSLKLLPFVIAAGVIGASTGRFISKKISDKSVNKCFMGVQAFIVCICLFNIIRYSLQ